MLAQARELFDWEWVGRNRDEIVDRVWEHLQLTGIALVVGFLVSFALTLLVLRWRQVYGPVTWVTGILYTIPSLALFALLIPFTGLSVLTAEIGLVSYTLLILVRNMVAGIDGVSPAVREAALGMGYPPRRLFWEIDLPLAMPSVVAGLRIASVTTVGLVTVTAIIGQGGLGFFILRGLQTFFWTQVLVGVVLSVVLATLLDLLLVGLQRVLTPWARKAPA